MDSLRIVMLILSVVSAIAFPIQLVRTIRRRDRGRIYNLLVSTAALGVMYSEVFWPNAIHAAAPPVRRFSKLPTQFGFSIEYTDNATNLRYYEPDFVAATKTEHIGLLKRRDK